MPISSVTHLLIHTVSIYRLQETHVGRGRWQDNTVLLAGNIRGRISIGNGSEIINAQERMTFVGPFGYFEPTQDIATNDYVVKDDVWYRVTAVLDPSIAHHRKVNLELVEKAQL